MKILVIGTDIEEGGGIATFSRNLPNILVNHDVDFYCNFINKKEHRMNREKYNIYYGYKFKYRDNYFANFFRRLLFLFPYISREVDINSYDVIILNLPSFAMRLKKFNGIVLVPQHAQPDNWVGNPLSAFFGFPFQRRRAMKQIKRLNATIVTPSIKYNEYVSKRLSYNNIIHIPYYSHLHKQEGNVRNKEILMVCRLDIFPKRPDLAINVMKYIPDFNLTIVGNGPDKDKLLQYSKDFKNVKIVDYNSNLDEVYSGYSFFMVVSDTEAFPIASIDAMQYGLIPIVRNTFDASIDITHKDLLTGNSAEEIAKTICNAYENFEFYQEYIMRQREKFQYHNVKKAWNNLIK